MPSLEKIEMNVFISLYRWTGGTVGGRMGNVTLLLLTSTGRKTGIARTTVVRYLRHGDAYMVTASNNGKPPMPGWFHNLRATPEVAIQVMDKRMSAHAEIVVGEERDALYAKFIEDDKRFARYQQKAVPRIIPVILFHPQ